MPHNQSLLLSSPILVVDADEAHTFIVCRMLEWAGYANITVSSSPREALTLYGRLDPDLVLLDLNMPGVNGGSLLAQLHQASEGAFLPVLVFTGPLSHDVKAAALKAGASDFLTKPGDSNEVLTRVDTFLQMRHMRRRLRDEAMSVEELVRLRTEELSRSQRELAERLAGVGEYRIDPSGGHARRVGELAAAIGVALGLPKTETDMLRMAAPLHDVGNVGLADTLLLKDGPFEPCEREAMMKHTVVGGDLLARARTAAIQMAETIARTHHERWDGTGYPVGLQRDEIPLVGRIVAVADVFDALTHDRPYKRCWAVDEATFEIESLAGAHFDPTVVQAFKHVLAERGGSRWVA